MSPKCKFLGKYELHHYSDQDSYVIAKFHVLCMFHCHVLILAPFFTPPCPGFVLSRQGITLTENDYPHRVQRSEKYPRANFHLAWLENNDLLFLRYIVKHIGEVYFAHNDVISKIAKNMDRPLQPKEKSF